MESSSRMDLLIMRRASLSFGRYLLRAEAIEELARRASLEYVHVGCGVPRVERVERLVVGRRRQVVQLLVDVMPMEGARHYAPVIDSSAAMVIGLQVAKAAAAMDEVLNAQ